MASLAIERYNGNSELDLLGIESADGPLDRDWSRIEGVAAS
jgi:hypothetical protein